MDKVRLGVLGAGNIAVMNVRGYVEDPRCDIVAVCDTDEEVGRQAAKEWGAESYYGDLESMLADDSIDAVEVLTPTHMHHDHVIAALEAGKHVSVQKPVANSVEDALEMEAVAQRVGRTLRISECFVHYPPLELAKRLAPLAIGLRVHKVGDGLGLGQIQLTVLKGSAGELPGLSQAQTQVIQRAADGFNAGAPPVQV